MDQWYKGSSPCSLAPPAFLTGCLWWLTPLFLFSYTSALLCLCAYTLRCAQAISLGNIMVYILSGNNWFVLRLFNGSRWQLPSKERYASDKLLSHMLCLFPSLWNVLKCSKAKSDEEAAIDFIYICHDPVTDFVSWSREWPMTRKNDCCSLRIPGGPQFPNLNLGCWFYTLTTQTHLLTCLTLVRLCAGWSWRELESNNIWRSTSSPSVL